MPVRNNGCKVLKGHDMENASEFETESACVIDCGVASQETKGITFGYLFELHNPPFDRQWVG